MAHPDEISKITQVQRKVNEVKDVMVENIEKVLERGERIELLVDKTDVLRNQVGALLPRHICDTCQDGETVLAA